MIFLTPCESCNRHVKTNERVCPFCGGPVTAAMRARLPRVPRERLGRAAMALFGATVAVGTATVGTAACGTGDEPREKSQPASGTETMPEGSDATNEPEPSPEGSNTMVTMMPTTGPMGNPVTPPQGDPTAVAAYGAPIMGPIPQPDVPAPVPRPVEPPPVGAGGASQLEPEPMMEPEPSFAALYGLPADFGEGGAPNDEADAGAQDAAAPDAGAEDDEPMLEPEPNVVALYGVTPLETE